MINSSMICADSICLNESEVNSLKSLNTTPVRASTTSLTPSSTTSPQTSSVPTTTPLVVQELSGNSNVTTVAGSSTAGSLDGVGTAATFNAPQGITMASNGTIYVVDRGSHTIRSISPQGVVTRLAGTGSAAFVNGPCSSAAFDSPTSIAVAPNGTVYIADSGNHVIRAISPSCVVSTVAGTGSFGDVDGAGTVARFYSPSGIVVTANGTLFVADRVNNKIRRITTDRVVSTFVG